MAPKRKGGARKAASKTLPKPTKEEEVVEEVKVEAPTAPVEAEKAEAEVEAEAEGEEEEEEEVHDDGPSFKKVKTTEEVKKGGAKRGRKPKASAKPAPRKIAESAAKKEEPATAKLIVIEASKECNSFKTRAAKVQIDLTKALPGLEVQVNPDRPRKGCFEIRDQDGSIFVSLLGMPRPFTKLKNLDLDKLVEEIVAKVK